MLEHAAGSRAVPVLDAFGNGDRRAGLQSVRFFSPDLIIPMAGFGDEDLAGAMVFVPECVGPVDEGHVRNGHTFLRDGSKERMAGKIGRVCLVIGSDRENRAVHIFHFGSHFFVRRYCTRCHDAAHHAKSHHAAQNHREYPGYFHLFLLSSK